MDATRAIKAFHREPTDRIPHCEIISCPDAMHAITGIDPWDNPQKAHLALIKKYALDIWMVPKTNKPIKRLPEGTVFEDEQGRLQARWGQETTWHWDWGARFPNVESTLNFDPLADLDFTWMDPVGMDLSCSVDELAQRFQKDLDEQREANQGLALGYHGFYNTLFMWPLLVFGWENFLELGALYPDECKRLLRDFAQISRKVFQAWAKTDMVACYCHDDICYQRGTVFSPDWLREFIYPYYEEFWSDLKAAGKVIFFVSDGNIDQIYDDVLACGADGFLSEVYTDWKEYKRKHPDKILIGGGDNQIIKTGDKTLIEKMAQEMADLGKDMPGYFYCVGNHIPYDMPVDGVKYYLDATDRLGRRT
jgi:hypothetical protein